MRVATLVGQSVLNLSTKLNLGSGSTWPGHIALKINPNYIKKAIENNPGVKIVLIAGTNGKTTTTKTIAKILEENNVSVMTNDAGANLLNGLATLIAKHMNIKNQLSRKALIFECDESTLPFVLSEIPNPDCVVLLNLFRDQLDRYGEVNKTAEKWRKAIKKLTNKTLVIANADDPLIAHTASIASNKKFFSIPSIFKNQKKLSHAVDSTTCPKCNSQLDYISVSYSHLGDYVCPHCAFKNPKTNSQKISSPLLGVYNQYNLSASFCVLKHVFDLEKELILKGFEDLKPAFGRQEIFEIDGKKIMLLLSKNPTGFNESLKVTVQNKPNSILLLLNDRVPDGRDISWIWDVDFENLKYLKKKIFVSGDRAYDLSNRLIFAGVTHEVLTDYKKAIKKTLKSTDQNGRITILATYSAMLEARKEITGKKIL